MTEELTEIEQSRDLLSKAVTRIDLYERLSLNPDFQEFKKELIDEKIDALFDLLEVADDKNLGRVRGQIEALRGINKIFESVLERKGQINKELTQLKEE